MPRILFAVLFFFRLSDSFSQDLDTGVVHTLFLLGDGGEPYVKETSIGKVLAEKIRSANGHSTVLFLGDNVYDRGLPDVDAPDYDEAESALKTQVGFIQGLKTRAIFIPGNHDWQHWGKEGLEYIENQQQW